MPRLFQSHGENHLADSVNSHSHDPPRYQANEMSVTRSAETLPKINLVKRERVWYVSLCHGVPPSFLLRKTEYGANATAFSTTFRGNVHNYTKMAKV
jgi:hypothetical protein